ncbi:helix-turn-helix domain-containing protein [Actinopolyspora mortivallis]|uniref:helix-turn-helix domain-containing protein n=1 Tax=Actinopolyspora mortivallis TaxID=33906 RepID=UPI001C624FDE|nr:helix-turn-helix domain-containing protein [Actinopolyspora mortivallis]
MVGVGLRTGTRRTAPGDRPNTPDVRVAVGHTRSGITGFRRSHSEALAVQWLLAEHPKNARVALHHDLEATVLAAQDRERATEFVPPLSARSPRTRPARLRETVRVFLDEADNAPRTAPRLHTHRNTVLQRVTRAGELLGYHPHERRLALRHALEIAHRTGPRVLTRP